MINLRINFESKTVTDIKISDRFRAFHSISKHLRANASEFDSQEFDHYLWFNGLLFGRRQQKRHKGIRNSFKIYYSRWITNNWRFVSENTLWEPLRAQRDWISRTFVFRPITGLTVNNGLIELNEVIKTFIIFGWALKSLKSLEWIT